MQKPVASPRAATCRRAYVTTFFHRRRACLRHGNWKISNLVLPFEQSTFGLFNLAEDLGETGNLATQEPQIDEELLARWREERVRLGIILPENL